MYFLADAYEKGNGAEKDEFEALEWYQKALASGRTDADEALKRLKAN